MKKGGNVAREGYLKENYHYFHLRDTAGQERDFHFHDFDKIVLLLAGRVDYTVENMTYPLNQSQITVFTEDMLEAYKLRDRVTAWDIYNSATEMYKAQRMDIPQLLPQNRAMVAFLNDWFNV